MDQAKKINSFTLVIIVVVIVGAVVWFITQNDNAEEAVQEDVVVPTAPAVSTQDLGNNPAEEVGSQIPNTNPLDVEGTNPFSGYNPFE